MDYVLDARQLGEYEGPGFDVVYCSHTLEHFEPGDVPLVLKGFAHVLKDDGFVEIRVPDIGELAKLLIEKVLDLNHVVYTSFAGVPVTIGHLIWGYGPEVYGMGEVMRHKCGFTQFTLAQLLSRDFTYVVPGHNPNNCELQMLAYKQKPEKHIYEEG